MRYANVNANENVANGTLHRHISVNANGKACECMMGLSICTNAKAKVASGSLHGHIGVNVNANTNANAIEQTGALTLLQVF